MTGLDTGYFVELLRGNEVALDLWKDLIEGRVQACCSALSVFELQRLALMGKIDSAASDALVQAAPSLMRVMWIDNLELMDHAARLSQGLGIPSMDSLILAGLLRAGCTQIYTTDSDFQRFEAKGVEVINLREQ
jgi:predicted nucleic acid-binding protein